jgi:hypothetical protein
VRGLGLAAAAGVKRLPFRSDAMGIPFLLPSLTSPSHPTLPCPPLAPPCRFLLNRNFVLRKVFVGQNSYRDLLYQKHSKYSSILNICLISVDALYPVQLCLTYSMFFLDYKSLPWAISVCNNVVFKLGSASASRHLKARATSFRCGGRYA